MGGQIWGRFAPIFSDLGLFLGHVLFHVGTFHVSPQSRGSLEASRGGMLEVIGAVGSIYVEGFAAVIYIFLRPCWSAWLLFSAA